MSKNDDDQLTDAASDTASSFAAVQEANPAPLSSPSADLAVVDDEGLAQELRRLAQGAGEVLVIANAYTVCVLHRVDAQATWKPVCCGELAEKAVVAAKPLARKRLWWGSTAGAPWDADPTTVPKVKATLGFVSGWLKKSIDESGREGDVTEAIKAELTYLAAWRCQFAGCGRNLRQHGATSGRGRFSYFAHIVAASPGGPRGNPVLSKLLASQLSNFILLCDECHRLIDKVNPAKYTVEVLRKMREDNIAEVQRLLGSLQHKPADAVELLPLRLVDRHDLHAGRVVDAAKNLVLRESQVEHLPCARVLPITRPGGSKSSADTLATVESHQVIQVLRRLRQVLVAGCAQRDLDASPVLRRIA